MAQVNFTQWGPIFLAPGATTTWWFTWIFDENHWELMNTSPDTPGASIEIVRQWSERVASATPHTRLWCTFRNIGSTGVVFRPKTLVAPA